MQNLFSVAKERVAYCKNYIVSSYLCASVIASSMASASAGVTIENVTIEGADKMVGTAVGVVCSMARYIGILLLVWGCVQLVMAFRNEDADSKSRAMMVVIMSIILISIKSLAQLFLTSAGV